MIKKDEVSLNKIACTWMLKQTSTIYKVREILIIILKFIFNFLLKINNSLLETAVNILPILMIIFQLIYLIKLIVHIYI